MCTGIEFNQFLKTNAFSLENSYIIFRNRKTHRNGMGTKTEIRRKNGINSPGVCIYLWFTLFRSRCLCLSLSACMRSFSLRDNRHCIRDKTYDRICICVWCRKTVSHIILHLLSLLCGTETKREKQRQRQRHREREHKKNITIE